MSDGNEPVSTRRRLASIVVVLIIVALLAGIILPVFWIRVDGPRRVASCGKNQSQILGAMVAYSASEEVGFMPRYLPVDSRFTGATHGRFVTAKIFEILSASSSIDSERLRCPSSAIGGPNKGVKPDPGNPTSTWGWGDGNGLTYALDWASSPDPSAARVIVADRDPKAHAGAVLVAFGDAHVKKIRLLDTIAQTGNALVTEGINGKPIHASTAVAPDDDIYSTAGDAGEPLTEGKGDPLRAWVK